MKKIARNFATMEAANAFYLDLCGEYESVKWLASPLFGQSGRYLWEVA